MAAIVRITWAQMKTEHVTRVSRTGDTPYEATAGRAERFIESAYLDIAQLWHHPELDATDDTLTLSIGDSSLAMPADFWIPFSFKLRDNTSGDDLKTLTWQEAHALFRARIDAAARPSKYTNYSKTLEFDSNCDAAYQTRLRYYKLPIAPDFASGSPAIDRLFDDHIIDVSVAKAKMALRAPSAAAELTQSFEEFAQRAPLPLLRLGAMPDLPETPKRTTPHGGPRG